VTDAAIKISVPLSRN